MNEFWRTYVLSGSNVEQVKIVVPVDEYEAVSTAMLNDGWDLGPKGHYTDRGLFPAVRTSHYTFLATRSRSAGPVATPGTVLE